MVNSSSTFPPRVTPALIESLTSLLGRDRVITGEKTEVMSKDFYWYSPVLKPLLDDKRAEVALRVCTKEELVVVVGLLYEAGVPVVVRGGGSGNYGQAVPLYGGAVIDLSGMKTIFSVEGGVVHAQAGATLREIEVQARATGWEMRCMPSTWAVSTIGGFLCGGSGGIGSILHGGIATADNVKSVTILSMEAEPELIRFEERESLTALHTYGTTGILVEVEMRLGLAYPWEELIFVADDWAELLEWTYGIAIDHAIPKRLVTQFEAPIPEYFKPFKKYFPPGAHSTFLMVDAACTEAVIESATARGIRHVYSAPFGEPPRPPYITDYTWNHTTLWAIKADPAITYLQCGFGEHFRDTLAKMKARFGDEFLIHLEMTLGNPKFKAEKPGVAVGGIPLVRFRNEARLNEIIDYCAEIGVFVANPHTYKMEEGGVHEDIVEKRALKDRVDPKGLLNPGKMKTYPFNPFEPSSV
jgi:FAD/FMN-containing dehydrogenase